MVFTHMSGYRGKKRCGYEIHGRRLWKLGSRTSLSVRGRQGSIRGASQHINEGAGSHNGHGSLQSGDESSSCTNVNGGGKWEMFKLAGGEKRSALDS